MCVWGGGGIFVPYTSRCAISEYYMGEDGTEAKLPSSPAEIPPRPPTIGLIFELFLWVFGNP